MAISAAQIEINLGNDILEGKRIRIDEDGFENFDDYFTETDSDDSDVEIVNHANDIKIVAVKPADDDDDARSCVSPLSLSNFPSRKRLSFPIESMSDSCSTASEEVSYVKRVISKRGMKSLANTSAAAAAAVSEDSDNQEATGSKKEVTTAKTAEASSAASNSNNKVRLLSKRGMKSFPEDEESFAQKVTSAPTEESLSADGCDPSAEEPETTGRNGAKTNLLPSSKECQDVEDKENEEDFENDSLDNNNDVLPEAASPSKKRKVTESASASPETGRESPRKVISAFGVHKPIVQKCFFDVFDTKLSLIDETEKSMRKFMKTVKKPESGGRSAEKNKDVSKDKSSPLRQKNPQPSPTTKQTLKNRSVPQNKSSPLKRKNPQPSPTAKPTLNDKGVPPSGVSQDKSSPSRLKKPLTTSTEKPTSRNKSVLEDKSPPSQHKKPRPSLAAKHSLKSKTVPSGVLKDKSSSSRHKKLHPLPIAKPTLKTKTLPPGVPKDKSPLRHKKPRPPEKNILENKSAPSGLPKDKSSPSKHKRPQPSPTAKQTSKSRGVPPPDVPEDKPSPQRHKKAQPSSTEKQAVKSKKMSAKPESSCFFPASDVPSGVSEVKSSPNKKAQTAPTEKPMLKSKNHINAGDPTTRSMRNKSPSTAVKPDDKTYSNISSSFAPKHTYRYLNNKMLDSANEHDIMYCCCLDSEKAFMGMISLKKGAYKQLNRSKNQVMFLVQFGKVKVRIGYKNMILTTGDSFMVPENEIYSLRNKSDQDCGLIVTILK